MPCTLDADRTAAVHVRYYELSTAVVFWTNVCFALYALMNGKRLSSVIGTVEEAARRAVVRMVRGKRLDSARFQEDTVSVRQRRVREQIRTADRAVPRRTTGTSASRQRIYDALGRTLFGIRPDVADTDDNHRNRSARPSKAAGIDLRLFRNLNTVSRRGDAHAQTVDAESSRGICTTCGQTVV